MATLKQVGNDIFSDLKKFDKLPRFLGATLFSETSKRIFIKGIKSSGSQAGNYSPTTISLKKEAGNFSGSKVNFRNTEQLANSYTFQPKKNEVLLGFSPISRTDGTTNEKVREKLEKKYGEIFDLTTKEDKLIAELVEDFTDKIFN